MTSTFEIIKPEVRTHTCHARVDLPADERGDLKAAK